MRKFIGKLWSNSLLILSMFLAFLLYNYADNVSQVPEAFEARQRTVTCKLCQLGKSVFDYGVSFVTSFGGDKDEPDEIESIEKSAQKSLGKAFSQ